MTEKLDYYEILGFLVPGILMLCWIPICFPSIASNPSTTVFPKAFAVIALVALAIFVGQLTQALASLIEPLLYKTWGGRPSDRALDPHQGLGKYLPADSSARIKTALSAVAGEGATDHSLFLLAMQIAENAPATRTARFNGLYAYHRALLVLLLVGLLLLLASSFWGVAEGWPRAQRIGSIVGGAVLLFLLWHRTKQRACYYVREVLLTAERLLGSTGAATGDPEPASKGVNQP